MDYTVHGIEFSRPDSGVDSLSLLQGIFPTQGSNPGLSHRRLILYQLSHQGSPRILEWTNSNPRGAQKPLQAVPTASSLWPVGMATDAQRTIRTDQYSQVQSSLQQNSLPDFSVPLPVDTERRRGARQAGSDLHHAKRTAHSSYCPRRGCTACSEKTCLLEKTGLSRVSPWHLSSP